MRNNLHLYHTVLQELCQWLPGEHISRKRNLALLVVGVYLSASVYLGWIVRSWPLAGKAPSLTNRLRRFLTNHHVVPADYYRPLAGWLIRACITGQLRLVIDTTQVGAGHRALVVGIAYRRRTLPLAWSLHRGTRGNVTVRAQIALLQQVYELVPYDVSVHLAGDAGFAHSDLLRWLRRRGWHFVIRQRGRTMVRLADGRWHRVSIIPLQPGQTKAIGWVWRAKTNPFGPVYLLLHWQKGEKEPWFLLSDQPDTRAIPRRYRRRMWIEMVCSQMTNSASFERVA